MAKQIGFKQDTSKPQLIINQLVIKPPRRDVLSAGKWRNALRSADNGRRAQLYDMYEDIKLDNVLSESIAKRIRAITNANLVFAANDTPVPEIDTLMQTSAFETMLKEVFLSKAWGKTVLELDFSNGFAVSSIPRKCLRTKDGTIARDEAGEGIWSYKNDDFFLEAGDDTDLGFLLRIAPLVIYKRGGFGDWAQFVEIFGMPQRIGKYNAYDQSARKQLEEAMEKMGSAPYLVVPKETDIETSKTEGKADGSVYNDFRQACNEEMLIGILGQTMTTVSGSSRSQSETHMEVEADLHADDQKFIARFLNEQFTPRLEKRGFPVKGGKWLFPEKGENISLKDRITIDVEVNNKVPVPKTYWYKTYGIPEPKDNEETTGGTPPPEPPANNDQQTSNSKQQSTTNKQLFDSLLSFFVSAPAQKVTGANISTGTARTLNLSDIPEFDITALAVRIAAAQKAGTPLKFDKELADFTATQLIKAFRDGWTAKNHNLVDPEFSYGLRNDMVQTAMEQNIYFFSAAKNMAQMSQLNQLFRESTGFEDFLKKAQLLNNDFNVNWLRTEYDTAYLTSESTATYYRLTSQAQTFPYWQYITVNDGRVRPEHASLHGLILPYNDKRWSKIYPPNGWNCRCYVIPLTAAEVAAKGYNITQARQAVDEYFNSKEWKKTATDGFGINRADLKKVFTENQMYVDDKTAKKLLDYKATDFGLENMQTLMKKAGYSFSEFTGNVDNWFNSLKKVDDNPVLTDYAGRNLVFDKKTFYGHIDKTGRTSLLNSLLDTVENPSEVWLNSYKDKTMADNYLLVKYYNNKTVVVSARINGGKYSVETWYELAPAAETMVRKGIWVK